MAGVRVRIEGRKQEAGDRVGDGAGASFFYLYLFI